MENITCFSKEVIEELKYYVYRLVDPRNGETFYVGKGKGNRVFAHAFCALNSYNGEEYLTENDDDYNLKCDRIRSIKNEGLEVIYIIQKYGLEERDAFIIESTLIDVYSINNILTNKIKGFDSYKGPINALTLEKNLSLEEYEDSLANPKYMIIKIKEHNLVLNGCDVYETVRAAWKIDVKKAAKYKYVLAVINGVVREVFEVYEWHSAKDQNRYEFSGKKANDSVRNVFIDKKIPSKYRKKGQASPVLYCKIN